MRQWIGPAPARYTPFDNGKFRISHGLVPFGTDCGQPTVDHHVFQLDELFEDYHSKKLFDLQTARDKHVCVNTDLLSPRIASVVTEFIVRRLKHEHPKDFDLKDDESPYVLHCEPTDHTIA